MGPDGETFVVAGWGLTKTRLIRVSNKGFWNNIYKKVYKLGKHVLEGVTILKYLMPSAPTPKEIAEMLKY